MIKNIYIKTCGQWRKPHGMWAKTFHSGHVHWNITTAWQKRTISIRCTYNTPFIVLPAMSYCLIHKSLSLFTITCFTWLTPSYFSNNFYHVCLIMDFLIILDAIDQTTWKCIYDLLNYSFCNLQKRINWNRKHLYCCRVSTQCTLSGIVQAMDQWIQLRKC